MAAQPVGFTCMGSADLMSEPIVYARWPVVVDGAHILTLMTPIGPPLPGRPAPPLSAPPETVDLPLTASRTEADAVDPHQQLGVVQHCV